MKILLYETNIQQIKNELQEKVKERIDQNQREYILREEMKVIREELGEDNTTSDIRQFEESLEKLEADDTVKERIQKEIARFKNVANSPSESSVVRGYIETLLDLPWNKKSVDNTDLKNAEQILNDDHYGLEKVKERVLEFFGCPRTDKRRRKSDHLSWWDRQEPVRQVLPVLLPGHWIKSMSASAWEV